jgi:hypothetical protein
MSSINPNNINGSYPIAGQDNDSQGFRDNFTNVKNNLTFAKSEIEDIQTNAILKVALAGTILDNNLNNAILSGAQSLRFTETIKNLGTLSGAVDVSWADAHFQYLTTNGAISLTFSGWPTSGFFTKLRFEINVASIADTLTLPSAVSVNIENIQGITGQVITFPTTGKFVFEFTTYNNGTTITVEDVARNYVVPVITTFSNITITDTTTSTSTTTGALIVAGGTGVNGNLHVGGVTALTGNLGVTGNLHVGGVTSLTGNLGVTGTIALTGNLDVTGALSVTTNATVLGNLTTGGSRIDAGYQYGNVVSNFSTTITSNVSRLILDPYTANTIANGTVTLPAGNVEAKVVTVSSTYGINELHVIPSAGTTLKPSANITLANGASATYFYHSNEASWYKIG